jgi:hypothetical protein
LRLLGKRTTASGPVKLVGDLNFVSVRLYPKRGQADEALQTLAGFAVGKPLRVEVTFPLACSPREKRRAVHGVPPHLSSVLPVGGPTSERFL